MNLSICNFYEFPQKFLKHFLFVLTLSIWLHPRE
jgi:hypothetical protein